MGVGCGGRRVRSFFFFSSRRRHTRCLSDWSSDVCSSDLIYCSTSIIEGRPVRRRSPAAVVHWLTEVRQCGFRDFYFVDNTFNVPLAYAKELCRKIIAAELGLDWWAILYPKWVDRELVELMARAGCTQVSLGFESGSEPVLRQLNKQFNCAEVAAIAAMFRDAGVKRNGFLLLGAPGETREIGRAHV